MSRGVWAGWSAVVLLALGSGPGLASAALSSLDAGRIPKVAEQESLEARIDALSDRIERLRSRLAEAPSEDVKVEWAAQIGELERQRDVARTELAELRSLRAGQRWIRTRDNLEHILQALEAAYDRTSAQIESKVSRGMDREWVA